MTKKTTRGDTTSGHHSRRSHGSRKPSKGFFSGFSGFMSSFLDSGGSKGRNSSQIHTDTPSHTKPRRSLTQASKFDTETEASSSLPSRSARRSHPGTNKLQSVKEDGETNTEEDTTQKDSPEGGTEAWLDELPENATLVKDGVPVPSVATGIERSTKTKPSRRTRHSPPHTVGTTTVADSSRDEVSRTGAAEFSMATATTANDSTHTRRNRSRKASHAAQTTLKSDGRSRGHDVHGHRAAKTTNMSDPGPSSGETRTHFSRKGKHHENAGGTRFQTADKRTSSKPSFWSLLRPPSTKTSRRPRHDHSSAHSKTNGKNDSKATGKRNCHPLPPPERADKTRSTR